MNAPLPTAALEALRGALGPKGVIEAPADVAPYLVEERGLFQGTAALITRPANTDEVAAVVRICAQHNISITPQGGNTGLVGGGVPQGGIVLATGRMNRVRALDPANHTLMVDAGCVLKDIQTAADEAGFLFPLSLGAEGTCQIGGNLATNAGGIGVLRYGNARNLVLGIEVVLADGQVWDGLRGLRKDNTGYDLKDLFIGAEGTLGIITGAVLKLFPKPKARATAFVGLKSVADALSLFMRLRETADDRLSAYELIGRRALDFTVQHIAGVRDPLARPAAYYVLMELTSPREDDDLGALLEGILGDGLESGLIEDATIAASETQADNFWHIRETIPESQNHEGGSIKHDVSVPVSQVPTFIEEGLKQVEADMPGIRPVVFGHMGDGNIHFNLSQPEDMDRAAFLEKWSHFSRRVHDLAAGMGGSFSAEHGIGQLKRDDLRHYRPEAELNMMRAIKAALDPAGIMNPGKVL